MVRLWNVQTWECIHTVQCKHGGITATFIFDPHSHLLIVNGRTQIHVWDIHSGVCVRTIEDKTERPWSNSITINGHILVSGNGNETITFWDIQTGKLLKTFDVPRPYEGMNITGATVLTDAQRETLRALGGVEDDTC